MGLFREAYLYGSCRDDETCMKESYDSGSVPSGVSHVRVTLCIADGFFKSLSGCLFPGLLSLAYSCPSFSVVLFCLCLFCLYFNFMLFLFGVLFSRAGSSPWDVLSGLSKPYLSSCFINIVYKIGVYSFFLVYFE